MCFEANEHNGVFSVFLCPGMQRYVTYRTLAESDAGVNAGALPQST